MNAAELVALLAESRPLPTVFTVDMLTDSAACEMAARLVGRDFTVVRAGQHLTCSGRRISGALDYVTVPQSSTPEG